MSRDRWPVQMTVQTAAEYLDVAQRKIEDLIREGELTAYQKGDRSTRFILRDECDSYARKCAEIAKRDKETKPRKAEAVTASH